jgi:hypothetical protein
MIKTLKLESKASLLSTLKACWHSLIDFEAVWPRRGSELVVINRYQSIL